MPYFKKQKTPGTKRKGPEPNESTKPKYGRRKKQVSKESLYMMSALWMEQSPWSFKDAENRLNIVGEEGKLNVVGAVFVLPNDRVLSVDCSRKNRHAKSTKTSQFEGDEGIVHGALQALIKYPDRVKDCKVYLSRKPCANCVKMLVQAAVQKVFYLPLRPEKEEDTNVDALFQVSTVSRSFFVPEITENDLQELNVKSKKPYEERVENLGDQKEEYAEGGWEEWKSHVKSQLGWEEYGEEEIQKQVDEDMKRMFKWFGMATFATGRKEVMDWEPHKNHQKDSSIKMKHSNEVASHLSRLAQMLSNRTDDPKCNVGCIIASADEIVSIGWNGFPSKALYGNHPRGSSDDKYVEKKYPHVIHAEQNALLYRNRRDLANSIAYVNKIPCNECMPMLFQLGVKDVVLPAVDVKNMKDNEKYFYKLLKGKQITVFTQKCKTKNRHSHRSKSSQ